jgi:hypothetical protein
MRVTINSEFLTDDQSGNPRDVQIAIVARRYSREEPSMSGSDETFTEVKQRVALHIDAQLRAMTEEERRAFLDKLLGMLGYEQVLALNFSYEMTPGQARGTAAGADKPYRCHECGRALAFPETFFNDGLTYCAEHSPNIGKESEGW